VRVHQIAVRERGLRVLVEVLHVRVRRRRVEVEVVLLDVLAVVALAAGQPEQALLEDRVAPVPQRQREAQPAVIVGDSGDAVLAPAVRARARVIVRKGVPGRAAGAVVLPNGAPLPLGEIRAPPPPVSRPLLSFLERSEEHTSELQSRFDLVCRLLLEKKKPYTAWKITTLSATRTLMSHTFMRLSLPCTAQM